MEPKFDSGELFKVVDQPLDEPINIGFYKPCQNSIDMVRRFRSMILGENTTPNNLQAMEQNEKAKRIAELYARGKELSGVLGRDPSASLCVSSTYIPQIGFLNGVEVRGQYREKILGIIGEELYAVSAELAELTK